MSEISRRLLLTGAATAPLFAQQTAQTPSPARDVIPQRHLLSSRCTAGSLQKSLVGSRSLESLPRRRRSRLPGAHLRRNTADTVIKEGEAFLGKAV